jgi:hypothetical protein
MRCLKDIEQHYATKISELTDNWMAWRIDSVKKKNMNIISYKQYTFIKFNINDRYEWKYIPPPNYLLSR